MIRRDVSTCIGGAALLVAVMTAGGCGKSPTQPSTPAPASSRLTFQVAAGAVHGADSGTYTTANATFGGVVRTTCVPNPNIAGSVCPDLMVGVRGTDGRQCVLWAFAPMGRSFGVGSYPRAAFSPAADTAGFFINCARGGTTCGDNSSAFTVHELRSNASGIVTRLHLTFEQTCLGGTPPSTAPFGKGTGELWIIDGTNGFP